MQLTELQSGQSYRVSKKPMIVAVRKGSEGYYTDSHKLPPGTVIAVLGVNQKSIRTQIIYRDKNKAPEIARLVFDDNQGDFELKQVQ